MKISHLLSGMMLAGASALMPNVATADPLCPDANILSGKLITDICWSCMMPIQVMGAKIGTGDVPEIASDESFCSCPDPLGLPQPGMVTSMWEPARLFEVVRSSGCSPTLGGLRLPLSDIRYQGGPGKNLLINSDNGGYYHVHEFAFPLLVMLEMFIDPACNSDGYVEMDVMYMSEVDPTFSNPQLSFFVNSWAAAFSNPIAMSACSVDAVSATAGKPLDEMFWCAGSWGGMLPLAGSHNAQGGFAKNTNLLATRALALQHTRGFARQTAGDSNLCSSKFVPMIPKSMYKFSGIFPISEGSSAHVIGENDAKWSAGKQMIPGVGEDAVIMMYRWNDCCSVF